MEANVPIDQMKVLNCLSFGRYTSTTEGESPSPITFHFSLKIGFKMQTAEQTVEEFIGENEIKETIFDKLILDISWMEHAEAINKTRRGLYAVGKCDMTPRLDEANRGAIKIARLIEQYNSLENEFHKTTVFSVLEDYLGIYEEDVVDAEGKIKLGFFLSWLKKEARNSKGK